MRSISLLVLGGLVALSCGYLVPERKVKTFDTDKDFVYKQRVILQLLQHVHQNKVLMKLWNESKLWRFEDNYNMYTNVEAVREFVNYYNTGLLPMTDIFTIYNQYHRDQVVALFHVFYYAKDFETFYKSLVWARFNVNEGMFIYYYYFHADYPFWMRGKDYNMVRERRGEQYLFVHQQLLARYYLERLSNDIGRIPEFSWYEPIRTGYYPALRYYNGAFFTNRDNFYNVYTERNYYDIDIITDYEHRIRNAIDLGYIIIPDGTHLDLPIAESIEYLGNLIQWNADSPNRRFYGYFIWLSKMILGGSGNDVRTFKYDYRVLPSVLEHYETTLRDPVFWEALFTLFPLYHQLNQNQSL